MQKYPKNGMWNDDNIQVRVIFLMSLCIIWFIVTMIHILGLKAKCYPI